MSEEKNISGKEIEAAEAPPAEETAPKKKSVAKKAVKAEAATDEAEAAPKKKTVVKKAIKADEPEAVIIKKPQHLAKEATVAELKQMIDESQTVLLVDYRGINVAEDTQLRRRMREAGSVYKVEKNTMIRRACNDLGISDLDPYLEGTTAIAFSSDPVTLAKTISQFTAAFKKLQVKAGLLDNKLIDAAQVSRLAKLPAREVLLAQLLGAMQSPLSGFAGVCAGMLRQLVTVVDKVREQKEAQ